MNDLLNKINKQNRFYRISMLTFSLVISALIYNLFLLKLNIVTGGVGGIATITKYIYNIDPSMMILLLSLASSIIGFMYLNKDETLSSIYATIMYPIFVKLTSPLSNLLLLPEEDTLIIIIFAGAISGIANGLMYKSGYTSGGFPVIYKILNKNFKISINKSSLISNLCIIILGSYFFGLEKAMYAIILLFINNLVQEKVLLGISNNKAFYIITSKEEEIKDYIKNNLHHNVTIFDVKGGFLEQKRKVLLSIIPSREYFKVTECLKAIDEKAFFIATDSYEVIGGK